MSTRRRTRAELLETLAKAWARDVLSAPEEEILNELREEYGDVESALASSRKLLRAALDADYRAEAAGTPDSPSASIVPLRPKPANRIQPPLLKMAALQSKSETAGSVDEENRSSPEKKHRARVMGRIVSGVEEATFHWSDEDVFIDLPSERPATRLHLGGKDYALSPSDRARRYLVNQLSRGVAKRFILNQAENPTKYQACWM